MKKPLLLTAAIAALSVSSYALAEQTGQITVSPSAGIYGPQDSNLDNGRSLNLDLGYAINNKWNIEASLSDINSEIDTTNADVNARLYQLNALYNYPLMGKLQPFALVGAGVNRFDPQGAEIDEDETLNLGLGAKYWLTDHVALRGDLRGFHSIGDSNNDWMASVGFTMAMGGKPQAAPAVEKPIAQPASVPAPAVKTKPLPKDLPVTEEGVRLDVYFDFDKAVVKPAYFNIVEKLANFMKENPEVDVVVQGHTDWVGTDAYNQKLSQRRAQAVCDMLVSKYGIDHSRLQGVGYGEARPIADNKTAEGRAKNRRVIAEINSK